MEILFDLRCISLVFLVGFDTVSDDTGLLAERAWACASDG